MFVIIIIFYIYHAVSILLCILAILNIFYDLLMSVIDCSVVMNFISTWPKYSKAPKS